MISKSFTRWLPKKWQSVKANCIFLSVLEVWIFLMFFQVIVGLFHIISEFYQITCKKLPKKNTIERGGRGCLPFFARFRNSSFLMLFQVCSTLFQSFSTYYYKKSKKKGSQPLPFFFKIQIALNCFKVVLLFWTLFDTYCQSSIHPSG